jgi:hypothetical protein
LIPNSTRLEGGHRDEAVTLRRRSDPGAPRNTTTRKAIRGIVLVGSLVATWPAFAGVRRGEVNGDGNLDLSDAIANDDDAYDISNPLHDLAFSH